MINVPGQQFASRVGDDCRLLHAIKFQTLSVYFVFLGGWVRDKLLGLSGKPDIDIALDTMTGRAFALVLSKWCHENGKEMSDVGIIQQNPEKSKHLETG